ncbi:DUF4296 domain-containing protein [Phaeodactylibacter sp.]|jgi:ArsR family metal-binding transcriptional regulator|uniref:DUF4296 domain-containing protein n=1 Tax=Phaeodactylibacter sp. TaxID=1940289 RepID=UPI0025DF6C08|nr:DUF4296 domain-containing protein [Phaeodactylibacter sp.]MCI4647806.1 DUF4296 domain-containing protein [Phaeodactylibacter sp.]MCI5090901.1 DUF4296 domain-containing protein [Phaeodactylibacter sp.]
MRYAILLLLACCLSLFFSGCETPEEKPRISEEKLIDVLADVHIAEAALQALRGQTKDSMSQTYYQQIYTIHGIDSVEMQQTLEAMREKPEEMKALYDKVMERVEKLNAKSKDPEERD